MCMFSRKHWILLGNTAFLLGHTKFYRKHCIYSKILSFRETLHLLRNTEFTWNILSFIITECTRKHLIYLKTRSLHGNTEFTLKNWVNMKTLSYLGNTEYFSQTLSIWWSRLDRMERVLRSIHKTDSAISRFVRSVYRLTQNRKCIKRLRISPL